MSLIGDLFSTPVAAGARAAAEPQARDTKSAERVAPERSGDRIDLSPEAQVEQSRSNEARIAEIKAEIANGTYLTDDKLDVAIDRLTRDLLG